MNILRGDNERSGEDAICDSAALQPAMYIAIMDFSNTTVLGCRTMNKISLEDFDFPYGGCVKRKVLHALGVIRDIVEIINNQVFLYHPLREAAFSSQHFRKVTRHRVPSAILTFNR